MALRLCAAPFGGDRRNGAMDSPGGCSSYRYMVRTSHFCRRCHTPPAMRPAQVDNEVALRYMHRWSRPELARSGGTGYSMQTIGQVRRWTGHQGTSCAPRSVSLRCWSLYLQRQRWMGDPASPQPLASSTYTIRNGCPLRRGIAFLFKHAVSMSQIKVFSSPVRAPGTCAQSQN